MANTQVVSEGALETYKKNLLDVHYITFWMVV